MTTVATTPAAAALTTTTATRQKFVTKASSAEKWMTKESFRATEN